MTGIKRSQYESVYYRTAQKRSSGFRYFICWSSPPATIWFSCRSPSLVSIPPGAFSFPFIFLATDLTVRIFGARWRDASFSR
ncbi:hypothetical protein H7U18_15470 [Klebsiella pneumoniae]|uniref:Uncharacterized protein n=1 Tax=Klebsiella pneumoniae TaxID=573 RepID=A0A923ENN5_KLEPN|nr:hypothetical protein [Klebsiella pneumoniae]